MHLYDNSKEWTPKRVAYLRELRDKGIPPSKIAVRLGGVSKSAVIGKMHRLGIGPLTRNERPSRINNDRLRFLRAPGTPSIHKTKTSGFRVKRRPNSDPIILEVEQPRSNGISFVDLPKKGCRYELAGTAIVKPDDFRFCGAPRHEHYPYCLHHCLVCYSKIDQAHRKAA